MGLRLHREPKTRMVYCLRRREPTSTALGLKIINAPGKSALGVT
jgi:hypothetical protein